MSSVLTFVRPISRRGQVVVPKDVRAHLRIGDEVVFEVHGDRVEIRSPDVRFLDAFLDVQRRRKSPSPGALKTLMRQHHENLR